jgi:sulfonate transport system substrate-binding protein
LKKLGLVVLLSVVLAVAGCSSSSANTKQKVKTINIGIQQSLGPLLLAKNKGWFEEEFEKIGVKVKWTEFQSGPPHFEGIASDRLDFGQVGNSPVISAQGADIPFLEISNASDGLKGNAIVVQKNSEINTIKDLKGKKVAVAKGSSGFNFLYRAIDEAGLKPNDLEIIQLQPDEAQPAFENGSVDAWAIWEPFISVQEIKNEARVLENGESLGIYSPGFTIVREKFAKENSDLVVHFLKVYEKARVWQNENFDETVEIFAKEKKIDPEIVKRVLENNPPLNIPITNEIIAEQQKTADFQYSLNVIKKKIDTGNVVNNSYIEKALKELEEGE